MLSRDKVDLDRLPKHDYGVTLHNSHTPETLARLEGFDDERLLRGKQNLSHFIGLDIFGILDLSTSSFLTHLPVDSLDLTGRSPGANKRYWGITNFELAWMIEDLDLSGEGPAPLEGSILRDDHNVTNTGHVQLVKALDVEADIISWTSLRHGLVMHLDREYLTCARSRGSVGRKEQNLVLRFDETLFDTTSDHITHTLDLIHTRDRHAELGINRTRRNLNHLLEGICKSLNVHLLLADHNVDTGPPTHVRGLGDEVVTDPSRNRNNRNALRHGVLFPADLDKHSAHLILNFSESVLAVLGHVAIHLVDANNELFDTQKIEQASMLTGLALNLTSLVITLGDRGNEITVGRNHEQTDISLRRTGNHVLDEIAMAWCVNNGIVVRLGEELLSGAGNSNTTSALLLRLVHVEGEGERVLSKSLGLIFQLLHFTLGNPPELKDQSAGSGRLASIDMTADNDGDVLLAFRHCVWERVRDSKRPVRLKNCQRTEAEKEEGMLMVRKELHARSTTEINPNAAAPATERRTMTSVQKKIVKNDSTGIITIEPSRSNI